jgi:hypothetical protein
MIHDALDSCTAWIQRFPKEDIKAVVARHVERVIAALDNPKSPLKPKRSALDGRDPENLSKESMWMSYYFDVNFLPDPGMRTTWEGNLEIALWVTLMFRMLCWFLLHDFDPMDVKIVPSNLKGSRIPVYIG